MVALLLLVHAYQKGDEKIRARILADLRRSLVSLGMTANNTYTALDVRRNDDHSATVVTMMFTTMIGNAPSATP